MDKTEEEKKKELETKLRTYILILFVFTLLVGVFSLKYLYRARQCKSDINNTIAIVIVVASIILHVIPYTKPTLLVFFYLLSSIFLLYYISATKGPCPDVHKGWDRVVLQVSSWLNILVFVLPIVIMLILASTKK